MQVVIETSLPNRLYRGKVRDTYDMGDGLLLMVATDRISAFDVELPNGIPHKGLVLSALSAFWFRKTQHIVPNHFVGMANESFTLAHWGGSPIMTAVTPNIARQAMVVKRAKRIDIECIVRGYITGSAWQEYTSQGTISGMPMSGGLVEGFHFPEPLFTPTTKAEKGHDQNMTHEEVVNMVGPAMAAQLEETSLAIYSFAHEYALQRSIILADTKMEFGLLDGQLILIDELLTPDSSRFWDATSYTPGRSLPNFDKQFVRDWLTTNGWDREPPAPVLPKDVVQKTTERYLEAYRRLTNEDLLLGEE